MPHCLLPATTRPGSETVIEFVKPLEGVRNRGGTLIIRFAIQKPVKTFMLRNGEVEAIKVHHFVPGSYKVMDKLLFSVRTCVDFRQSPELGV